VADGPREGSDGWGASSAEFVSVTAGIDGRLPIVAWFTTTMLGVAVFAWVLRRPQREHDSPLAAALSVVAAGQVRFSRDFLESPTTPSDPSGTDEGPDSALAVAEPAALSGNRPSGWQTRPPLLFTLPADRGVVRRLITHRLVRLSDAPDDLRSGEIMRLDRGDEAEILGQEGNFLWVRTPTGEVGWIPTISIIG
jgi:hypothetical protein